MASNTSKLRSRCISAYRYTTAMFAGSSDACMRCFGRPICRLVTLCWSPHIVLDTPDHQCVQHCLGVLLYAVHNTTHRQLRYHILPMHQWLTVTLQCLPKYMVVLTNEGGGYNSLPLGGLCFVKMSKLPKLRQQQQCREMRMSPALHPAAERHCEAAEVSFQS